MDVMKSGSSKISSFDYFFATHRKYYSSVVVVDDGAVMTIRRPKIALLSYYWEE